MRRSELVSGRFSSPLAGVSVSSLCRHLASIIISNSVCVSGGDGSM